MKYIQENEVKIDESELKNLSKQFNLNEKVIEILYNRGFSSKDKIDAFLHDDLKNLNNPYLLKDMKGTIDRINLAIENQEKVVIFGDYDVDGISAISVLYLYLKDKIKNLHTYMPNRFEDGYGLSCSNLDYIQHEFSPNLIITVDCGISCYDEVEYIKSKGTDIIVTDHHDIPEKVPNCLIVNPKQENQEYPFKFLCGAGVAFKIVQALCEQNNENYEQFLPITAIATIADIVPLVEENRILVKYGLKHLDKLPLGVKLLFKNTFNKLNVSSTDIAFKIAPKINSAGRLDDANISLNLYISNDLKVINKSLNQLEYYNNKRKELCEKILNEAENIISKLDVRNKKVLVLEKDDWDNGVLGIVSARICEKYNKPTILLCLLNGELKGSARSIDGVDIFQSLNACKNYLIKFGGHTKAGGLSLKPENLKQFSFELNKYISSTFQNTTFETIKKYDLDLKLDDISVNLVENLQVLEPFGYGNYNPTFKVYFSTCNVNRMKNNPKHLLIELNKNLNMISFNDSNYFNYQYFNQKNCLVELQLDEFKGRKKAKLMLKSVKFDNIKTTSQAVILTSKFNQIKEQKTNYNFNNIKEFNSIKQLENIIDSNTLIVTYNAKNYETFINFNKCCFSPNSLETQVCYGLINFEKMSTFNKVVFLETPLNDFYLNYCKNANIYLPMEEKLEVEINLNRDILLNIYFSLTKINFKQKFDSFYDYFVTFLQINSSNMISYADFYLALLIFEELGLINITIENEMYSFNVIKTKTNLENSNIYKQLILK